MPWQDAVQETPAGCVLLLEVAPGSKQAAFPAGWNRWRGRIGIAVRAAAQDGKANQEVLGSVAEFFDVPDSAVTIASGATDRRKRVVVAGLTVTQACSMLEGHL